MRGAGLNVALCIFVGILVGSAWMVFADGVLYAQAQHDAPPFQAVYAVPAIGITFAMLLLNIVSPREMRGGASSLDSDEDGVRVAMCARIWVFIMITLGFAALGGAIWVAAAVYTPEKTTYTWPGGAVTVHVCLILFAGLLYFMRPRFRV